MTAILSPNIVQYHVITTSLHRGDIVASFPNAAQVDDYLDLCFGDPECVDIRVFRGEDITEFFVDTHH